MVTSKETLEKIRKIIEKNYKRITIGLLGKTAFSQKELEELKDMGVDISNSRSILEKIYYHNFINNPRRSDSPSTYEEALLQQDKPNIKPTGEAHDYSIDSMNDKTKQMIVKLKEDVIARVEGYIRDNNDKYKLNALQNLERDEFSDNLAKESSLGYVKRFLRESKKGASRDWQRVAFTEMSNAIGAGSVDRIVSDNIGSDLDEIYVYRIIVGDANTCKWCRKFYGDVGQAPKLYRLSTLLANGSNYGKKRQDWKAVVGATHPNTRTSQIIELKPGFILTSSGSMTYIGLNKWKEWVFENLDS